MRSFSKAEIITKIRQTGLLGLALMFVLTTSGQALAAKTNNSRGFGKAPTVVKTPFLNGTYRALIIGNNKYKDPTGTWVPLKTAVNDADAIASVLKSKYGFGDVMLVHDATRRDMVQAFNEMAKRSKPEDSVLIYYAGHGYLNNTTKEGYWIPVDAEGRDDSTFIPNATIKTKMAVIADKARHVMLISDSCFSGALLRAGNRGINLDAKTEAYYRKVAQQKSVQILAAGGLEFVDDNYKGTGHSPFTYYLLNELNNTTTPFVEATQISLDVTRNVSINVNQTPEKGVLQGAGHAGGEFFFLRSDLSAKANFSPAPSGGVAQSNVTEGTRALAPVAAPVATTTFGAAASSAGVGAWAVITGGAMELVAVLKYLEASAAHGKAADTASTDPEESTAYEEQRNSAATLAIVSGLAGVGMMSWWYFSGDDGGTAMNGTNPGWSVLPYAVSSRGIPTPGVSLMKRW